MIFIQGGLVDLGSNLTRTRTSERNQAARVIARALQRRPEKCEGGEKQDLLILMRKKYRDFAGKGRRSCVKLIEGRLVRLL